MRSPQTRIVLSAVLLIAAKGSAASDMRGKLGFDAQWFPSSPLFADQSNDVQQNSDARQSGGDQNDSHGHFSGYAGLQWADNLGDDSAFALDLFARAAPNTDDEYFGDIREATVNFDSGDNEFKAGVLMETWGVLDAWNPVDIVNQKDMVEDFQGDAKLGQPGVAFVTRENDFSLSLLALTYARERRIAEGEDRLRTLPERVRSAHFEDGRMTPSLAARAQYRIGDLDLALSQFWGHAREPVYSPRINAYGQLTGFDSYYRRVAQTGLETQYVVGDSVLKSELIYQRGGADNFFGGGVGFESTFSHLGGSFKSLTFYAEYYRDNRDSRFNVNRPDSTAPLTPFEDDVFVGVRYNFNDTSDTLLEARCTHDLEWHSNLVDLRAQRRVDGIGVVAAQVIVPLNVKRDPALQGFERDKYLKLGLTWYF